MLIEPNIEEWRKPVLATVPASSRSKWGKGTFESLQKL